MSGIFGMVQRNGAPLSSAALDQMRGSMADWAPDGASTWHDARAGLGLARLFSTPECQLDRLPRVDAASGTAFTAAARVDNRAELGSLLDIPSPQQAELSDGEFLFRAYLKWGEDCSLRVFGDWAFAAWHPAERKLLVARDHFGNTSLFYHETPQVFAFASSRQALLDLNLAPRELDELYLAQVLVCWTASHGEGTIHRGIQRLPPAHTLRVTPYDAILRQYWRLEETPETNLPRPSDYVEGLRQVFDQAVRARLRAPHMTDESGRAGESLAVSLSGGLDSGAVAATAAGILRAQGRRLPAFTSVPLSDPAAYAGKRIGDELPLATATAQFSGNVDLHAVAASGLSPMQALRRALQITQEPVPAAANFYWLLDLQQSARALGCRVLLTGQMGHAGLSWTGDPLSLSLADGLRVLGLSAWTGARLQRAQYRRQRALPTGHLSPAQLRRLERNGWHRGSAIRLDFAERLHLLEQRLNDPAELPAVTARERRQRILLPGQSLGGALHAQMGAAHGLELRDPTGDARVLAFALSVPDRIFMDAETGLDRWLIRAAMQDRLPEEVRLNRRRGRQAADLVPRLRACATEVETALGELALGPAAAYVDVPYLREAWHTVQTEDTPRAFRLAVTVLTRGIMAGLFVNQFAESSPRPAREPKPEVLAARAAAW